ncbi:MAG: hypothetical protein PWQ37_1065 [Candidatus Petromonas sp.]|jgi:cell division protein FtsW (lipid II flippase)|nr:hypothetical protein [Candidatus Petromonas sp.]
MKRRGLLIRKILGVILGLTGTIIVIEFVPLKIWYTILFCLLVVFLIILFRYLSY